MSNVQDYIYSFSDSVEETYQLQAAVFGPTEYARLQHIFQTYRFKTLLDVGTGEGDFIIKAAPFLGGLEITAIDADEKLIGKARSKHVPENINFQHAMFNSAYCQKKYDSIFARFAIEHVADPDSFIQIGRAHV